MNAIYTSIVREYDIEMWTDSSRGTPLSAISVSWRTVTAARLRIRFNLQDLSSSLRESIYLHTSFFLSPRAMSFLISVTGAQEAGLH